MKNKFLGIICLIYSGLIIYVWVFDKMKNFLAPNMQMYLKLSLILLLLMGLVLCFNQNIKHKFKLADLILFLPLVLFILCGDGRLTTTLSVNRTTKLKKEKVETKIEEIEEIKEDKEYDFNKVDFDVVDEAYEELIDHITYTSKYSFYTGKTIRVKGFTFKKADFLTDDYFLLGKYSISCCAADASYIGFIVKYDIDKVKNNAWYEIEGVLEKAKTTDGVNVMAINVKNIKKIDETKEEQYVYPCYAYDNGLCSALDKYDIK